LASLPQDPWVESHVLTQQPSAPISVIVAEPDPASRRLICSILESESGVTVRCVDNSRLFSTVQDRDPDLVILDLHSTEARRVAGWEDLGVKAPPVTIFTTYDATALPPFASASADLLIKPFNVEQLQIAIDAARSKVTRARAQLSFPERSSNHEDAGRRAEFLQRVAAESGEKIILIRVKDILWLQSYGNHIRLHLWNASHLVRHTLKNFQALLDPNYFLRVHRNAIVNLDHVIEFFLPPKGNMFVTLSNGKSLPLRRANRALLRKKLKSHFLA
jgi:two-component system, LytTR family, response regulator